MADNLMEIARQPIPGTPEAPHSEVRDKTPEEVTAAMARSNLKEGGTDPRDRPRGVAQESYLRERLPQFAGKMYAWAEALNAANIHADDIEVRLRPAAFNNFCQALGYHGYPLTTNITITINGVDFVRAVE